MAHRIDRGGSDSWLRAGLGVQATRSIFARYAILVLGTIVSVVLSRALEADGRGAYAYIVAFASTIAWAAHLSVETALVLKWSSQKSRKALVGASVFIAVAAGGAAAILAALWLASAEPIALQGVRPWMLAVAITTTPAVLLALYMNAVLANDGRIETINRVALAAAGGQLAVLLVLVLTGNLTVATAIILWAVSMSIPAAILFQRVRQFQGIVWPGLKGVWGLLSTGLKYHPGALALALILRVDVLLLAPRVDIGQVGIYSLAVALVELALVATSALSQVALQVQVRGAPEDHREFTASVARANALVAGLVLTLLLVAGPWAITFVFGNTFRGTMSPILLLTPGILALAISRPIGVYLTRLDRPFWISVGMILGLVGNVIMNLVLIPIMGIVGAALASSLVYLGLFAWLATWFVRRTGIGFWHLIPTPKDMKQLGNALRIQLSRAP